MKLINKTLQKMQDNEMKKDDQQSSSETSSYKDSEEESVLKDKAILGGKEMEFIEDSEDDLEAMMAEEEDGGSKAYLKTHNEISPEEIEKMGPEIKVLDNLDQINPFGQVV